MSITIVLENPTVPHARALIDELEAELALPEYPPEAQYGYSVEKLITQGVLFFVIWVEGEPVGCGGIQFFEEGYGELKRMFVRPQYRGMGLGRQLILHLEEVARQRGIGVVRLETGTLQREAIGVYERMGFRQIPAFGAYRASPVNVFYEKLL